MGPKAKSATTAIANAHGIQGVEAFCSGGVAGSIDILYRA
jgi:hypothetical protein